MTVRGSIAGLAEARTAKEARTIDEYCIFGDYGWCMDDLRGVLEYSTGKPSKE